MTTTTPRPSLQSPRNTSFSRGSGSHHSYQSSCHQSDYKSFLQVDLEDEVTLPFDDFLHVVFDFPKQWRDQSQALHAIVHKDNFQKLLSDYCQNVGHETERYHPFVNLANYVVEELRDSWTPIPPENTHIVFCRNDHIPIRGSFGKRIPDVVVVQHAAVSMVEGRYSVDYLSKNGPEENPFHWSEILSFFEFELNDSSLEFTMNEPLLDGVAVSSHPIPPSTASSTNHLSATLNNPRRSGRTSLPMPSPPFPGPPRTSSHSKSRTSTSIGHLSHQTSSSRKRPRGSGQGSQRLLKKARRTLSESTSYPDDMRLRCASYALEMLSRGGLRNHVLSALVTDGQIELLYYDHSIPVISKPLYFLQDPLGFVALLSGMAQLTSRQWGHHIALKTPPPQSNTQISLGLFEGSTLHLDKDRSIMLHSLVSQQHALIGRGTCVVRATADNPKDQWAGKSLIVKFIYTPEKELCEADIIREARNLACDKHAWVLDHLPEILYSKEISLGAIQQRLSECLGNGYEKRVFTVLVQEELFPITQLADESSLAKAIRDIFLCYKWLYEEAKILHRDISLNNFMYRKKQDGGIHGVLNDYDLSSRHTRESFGPTSKQPTGTPAFMAIDLLEPVPPKHMYRHDLESLCYVLIFLTSRYHNGEVIPDPPFQSWLYDGREALRIGKLRLIPETTTRHYSNFIHWTIPLRATIARGYFERHNHEILAPLGNTTDFDDETLGGNVNFDKFYEILFNEDIPLPFTSTSAV